MRPLLETINKLMDTKKAMIRFVSWPGQTVEVKIWVRDHDEDAEHFMANTTEELDKQLRTHYKKILGTVTAPLKMPPPLPMPPRK
jgi:hypothetical protein